VAKRKRKPADVQIPALNELKLPAALPAEVSTMLDLLRKGLDDAMSLSAEELDELKAFCRDTSEIIEQQITLQDRARADELSQESWDAMITGDADACLAAAVKALELSPLDAVADYMNAMSTIKDHKDMFEALGACILQAELDLKRSPSPRRRSLLREVRTHAMDRAGLTALRLNRYESAIGPLMELMEEDPADEIEARHTLMGALVGAGEWDEALNLRGQFPGDDHPVMAMGEALARLMVKEPRRSRGKPPPPDRATLERVFTAPPVQDEPEPMDGETFAVWVMRGALRLQPELARRAQLALT